MKTVSAFLGCCAALLVMVAGCKTDDSTPTNINNTGGNNNNVTSGNLKITSWSPERPHPDEIITITGTGFSDDDTANHVQLYGLNSWNKDLDIISATTTEIRARIPAEDSIAFYPAGWKDNFRIIVGNATYTHDKQIHFHARLWMGAIRAHTHGWAFNGIIPGGRTEMLVRGHDPSAGGLQIYLAGRGDLQIDSIFDCDAYLQQCSVYVSSPPSLMMQAPVPWPQWLCDSQYTAVPMIVKSGERSISRDVGVQFIPEIQYDSISPRYISIEDLNNISQSGGSMFVTIYGKNLYGRVYNLYGGFPDQIIGVYQDRFAVQIGGLGWKVPGRGAYQLIIQTRECNGTPAIMPLEAFSVY
jgi:hypothetical protein